MTNFRAPCEGVPISKSSESKLPQKSDTWILVATILGSSMAFIDGTIVNVALPALQSALKASVSQVQWVIEAYALMLGALLIVGGVLGDLYGRRFIFCIGVLIFAVASAWCGLASTITHLIIARTIQGIGAALLVPGSLAIITASFPEERRGQAIGVWSGFTAITTAAGPVLGGWLVQNASWRWIFFLNLPLACAVLVITLLHVPETKKKAEGHGFDIIGAFLVTLGLGALVYGLIEWQRHSSIIVIAEIAGICLLLAFLWVEAHSPSPMVSLKIFQSRNFSGANLITFLLYFALYGVLFFFPLDLIQVQGYTATEAGAAFLPFILLMFFLSRWAGGLVKRVGARLPLIVGPAIVAIGFALFLRGDIGGSYWTHFFPATFVLGIGMAISVAPLTTVVMNSVPQDNAGEASGINNAISRIAGLLAIAMLGLVMIMIFNQQLLEGLNKTSKPDNIKQAIIIQRSLLADIKTNDEEIRRVIQESFIAGYNAVLWIAVLLAIASSLSAAIVLERIPKNKLRHNGE